MRIDLAGFGPGSPDMVTGQVLRALSEAEVIITSARLADVLRKMFASEDQICAGASSKRAKSDYVRIFAETSPRRICELLETMTCENVLCLFGGDSSFYSGAAPLKKLIDSSKILQDAHAEVRILPGISSLSAACARLGIPFRELEVFSAHGRACDPVRAVMNGKKSFFLTGGKRDPAALCRELTDAGLGELKVTVCEMLYSSAGDKNQVSEEDQISEKDQISEEDQTSKERQVSEKDQTSKERIRTMTAEEASEQTFLPLSVMIADPAPVSEHLRRTVPGIADEEFIRGNVPMTKRLVRVSALSMLDPAPEDVCWDLGAGTGSISVELSARCARVISVERDPEALHLMEENRKRFGAWNMQIVEGTIPDILPELPAPDAIFIGGGGREIRTVLKYVQEHFTGDGENPGSLPEGQSTSSGSEKPGTLTAGQSASSGSEKRSMPNICASAITLETLSEARLAMEEYGYEVQIVQTAVTEVKKRGNYHMMNAQNPVFLIAGTMKNFT